MVSQNVAQSYPNEQIRNSRRCHNLSIQLPRRTMANFSQTHPQLAAKIADQIEYGLDPEQIIKSFKEADERKELEAEEGKF